MQSALRAWEEDSVYCFCTKFSQLILRKLIKIVAAICQILRPKCTKIQFWLEQRIAL